MKKIMWLVIMVLIMGGLVFFPVYFYANAQAPLTPTPPPDDIVDDDDDEIHDDDDDDGHGGDDDITPEIPPTLHDLEGPSFQMLGDFAPKGTKLTQGKLIKETSDTSIKGQEVPSE